MCFKAVRVSWSSDEKGTGDEDDDVEKPFEFEDFNTCFKWSREAYNRASSSIPAVLEGTSR